ncbi:MULTISPECIES: excisionase [Providencia]|uniref:excisionase n=1 Tax=Providencia TaxID=586 RepID=UPI001C5B859F|nr:MULTISPECIES: excisionase [Providencia]QXX84279.1 excisionase [Providencia sp. R33]
MSRMVSLEAWAKIEFGESAPSTQVLRKYAKANMMVPPALKMGKRWVIDRDSRWVGIVSKPQLPNGASDKLKRILSDGSKTTLS